MTAANQPEIHNTWAYKATTLDGVIELRAIDPAQIMPAIVRQYRGAAFRDKEKMLVAFETDALALNARGYNIYTTLNPIKPFFKGHCANDIDMDYRDLLLVDIDRTGSPKQPANEAELMAACEVADKVEAYFAANGEECLARVMSGNGYHLYYVLTEVKNDNASTAAVKNLLDALAAKFDNEHIKIDTSVYNASRITKVCGCIARKGTATADRPYRMCVLC
ncbi:MAG: hypothetical protein ACXW1W_01285 [Methylococcaceae bacterium]